MTSPNLDPQVRLLAGQIATLQKRIFQLERNQRASAGPASIAAGGLTVTDPGGVPQVIVGQQSDGSYGVQSVTPQVPVAPDQPLAGPGILGIWVYWDGQMSDGSNPLLDLNSVQVHCSAQSGFTPSTATLQGVLTGPGLFGVGNLTAGTTYYACFVAVNQAGNTSPPSDFAQATAQSVPAGIPAGSISGLQIQTGTLTAAQLAAEAGILGGQIAQNTITDGNIQAGTITANSIASNVITASLIEAGTIDAGLLAAGIVYAGIVDGTTVTGATLIADGSSGQILVYSGTPAHGNLIGSWSGLAGVDGFTNSYPQGLNVSVGTISGAVISGSSFMGTDFVMNASGLFIYSGTPASGNLILSAAAASGTDGHGNAYAQGVEIQHGGLILDSQGSAPAGVSGASTLYTSSSGRLRYLSQSGADLVLDRSALSLGNVSMTTQTSPVIMSQPLNYLAGEAAVGSEYELEIDGTITTPSITAIPFTFSLFSDGAIFGSLTSFEFGSVMLVNGQTFGYTVRYRVTVDTTGAGGTATCVADGGVSRQGVPLGNIQTGGGMTASPINRIDTSQAWDTTSNHTLAIYGNWTGSPTSGSAITYRTKTTRRN